MNHQYSSSNDILAHERPREDDERQPERFGAFDVGLTAIRESSPQRNYGKLAVVIVLIFWTIQYAGTSYLVWAMNPLTTGRLYIPRALVSVGGVAISFAMIALQNRLRNYSLSVRGVVAVVMAFVAPGVSVILNYIIFYHIFDFAKSGLPTSIELVQDYVMRLWYFGSLSGIILALSYAGDIRERETRIHVLQQLAHSAQLRALRNQLNPHFLFNALNSIAALINGKRAAEAETMTENLADFLRMTLALDPQQLITLDEEIELQELYLTIEQVRFPGRLAIAIDIPDTLRGALVPSLITQPLIENSIKYAVARSQQKVALTISARRVGDRVELIVGDDGGDADRAPAKGARMGLSNVAERLRAHFGEGAAFLAEAVDGGGFRNHLSIPFAVRG